ncbi:unnamed protein product [Auanema sp. JU1783]|nr:unnamed protein product [Auanema sp. JU1783]
MTFNIWQSGANVENGLWKIAKHISIVDPDVVTLQEVSNITVISDLEYLLGRQWKGVVPNKEYPDVGILTKHSIHLHSFAYTNWTMGLRISLTSGHFINIWTAHLQYRAYGPYAAFNKLVTKMDQIMAGEKPSFGDGRWHNMMEVYENPTMRRWLQKCDSIPFIFTGDFNCPSHLDWTLNQTGVHGGWSVEWPATKILEQLGFIDSYRYLYPNPSTHPGNSWSTVNKFNAEWDYTIPEPQDRIDFIYFKGPVKPIRSFLYKGNEPLMRIPYHMQNDYPSDHYALISDFQIFK